MAAGHKLPIDRVLDDVVAAARSRCVVVEAEPGAGKTTRVPTALLDAGFGPVLVTEPRRLAARSAARWAARERGASVGGEVGYHVRFDRKLSQATQLAFVTSGILVRRLQDDPFLEGVGCVVFDEFHERQLDADLALALVRRVQQEARPELVIVVMSATLDGAAVARFLGDCPRVTSEGRSFPVATHHLPAHANERTEEHVVRALRDERSREPGDALVFLPGVGEIRRTKDAIERALGAGAGGVHELYGDLSPERQDALLRPGRERRIILATNVAETSVTLPGIRLVIDSGQVRRMRHVPELGLDRLELGRVSLASADQRRGRAGRTAPGTCLRLWSALDERSLSPFEVPEIARLDLAASVLQLLCWGESDLTNFPWFEAPPAAALLRAFDLLERLRATDKGRVTELGRALGRLPLHPRLARLLVEGAQLGVLDRACLAAALLSEREPFERRRRDAPVEVTDSDLLDRIELLEAFERNGTRRRGALALHAQGANYCLRAAEQFERMVDTRARGDAPDRDAALLMSVFRAFEDRLARRRTADPERALQSGGRGVRLARSCGVRTAPLFVCIDVDAGANEALVRQASAVERSWLDPDALSEEVVAEFDAERERVVGRKLTLYRDLPLESVEHPVTDPAQAEAILLEAALAAPERALNWKDKPLSAWLARLRSLAEWLPDADLPTFDGEQLRPVLEMLVSGCRSFADLRKAPLMSALQHSLTRDAARLLSREAPERVRVPSGRELRLTYEPGSPPVLAARIQELFGLERTPTVASGRVPVLVHLLAPNGRPQQVTQDLASFWDSTYATVRKELRRRYPKHAWPEDPRRPGAR